MDKLTLAHEYVKTILSMNNSCHTMDDAVNIGWQYADLMYAEQEKRIDKTRPVVLVSHEHKKESAHLNNLG